MILSLKDNFGLSLYSYMYVAINYKFLRTQFKEGVKSTVLISPLAICHFNVVSLFSLIIMKIYVNKFVSNRMLGVDNQVTIVSGDL